MSILKPFKTFKTSSGLSLAGVCILLFGACVAADTNEPDPDSSPTGKPVTQATGIQVEVLSRGRGVPEQAWQAYQDIKALAEQLTDAGAEVRVSERVLGLEGERQMCIAIEDTQQADEFYEESKALAQDIELMRVSREPCDTAPDR